MIFRSSLLALAALACAPGAATAAESYDNCTGFIDSLPATISTQGTWCLRKDLSTPISTGAGITVVTNNVAIDCNGFKVGNLEAGSTTRTYGVRADRRLAITVRDCNVRGFLVGIALLETGGGNHRVEDNRIQGSTWKGIEVAGDGSVVRGNAVQNIGGASENHFYGIDILGAVSVSDNTVSGVQGLYYATGINAYRAVGSTIAGNRVRGVTSPGQVVGIQESDSYGSLVIRDNYVVNGGSGGASAGISCSNQDVRAKGNTIQGFPGSPNCGDAGRNDISP